MIVFVNFPVERYDLSYIRPNRLSETNAYQYIHPYSPSRGYGGEKDMVKWHQDMG
jgi:hypothetical protein